MPPIARTKALLLPDSDWSGFRQRVAGCAMSRRIADWTVSEAYGLLERPPVERKLVQIWLLFVSREAQRRLVLLSLGYRLTQDSRLLDRCEAELSALVAFEDFNPSHFLDTAEMAAGLALADHWLADSLAPQTRASIRQALVDKVLKPARGDHFWWTAETNWNSVCLAGLSLAASTIESSHPALFQETIDRVRRHSHYGFGSYEAQGVYPEGVTYWTYGTTFAALLIECLDWLEPSREPVALPEAFEQTTEFRTRVEGTSGRVFTYADVHKEERWLEPVLFWFARRLNRPECIANQLPLAHAWPPPSFADPRATEHARRVSTRFVPFMLMWPAPDDVQGVGDKPKAWSGGERCPVWTYTDEASGMYVAAKGGSGAVNHAHLDAGSFVLDLGGKRWATDLGGEDYTSVRPHVKGLFNPDQESDRWSLLRHRNQFHNTMTVADRLHDPKGHAPITRVDPHAERHADIDMTAPLRASVAVARRRISIVDRNTVRIIDRVGGATGELCWTMLTSAAVDVESNGCKLTLGNETVLLRVLRPSAFQIKAEFVDLERASYESPCDGITRIRVLVGACPQVNICVSIAILQSIACVTRLTRSRNEDERFRSP